MKRIEDIKKFEDIDTYYEISKIVDEVFQDRVEVHKHLVIANEEIERLNNKYNKALELLIDYNLPCEIDDFMNVHSDYCETHCGVDEEQYKRCWDKFIEWKLGSDKE